MFSPVLGLICLLFHPHGVSIRTSDAKNVGQLQPASRRGYKDQRRINFLVISATASSLENV